MKLSKDLEKLADQYDGNLLNYFAGLTPEQSKTFNKMVKKCKK
jgi:succinate dehydrogenase flavin-adding protein (antitoxin of CptAB toxin-antitoxin module)|tara:strand:- start:1147 stop:1275 length:129 start_codon:yes stop_codon:yes gene_type:complete